MTNRTRSKVDQPLIEDDVDEVLEFARYSGPGTMIYPSPRPEVRDLVLKPLTWTQIDPVFRHSGDFVRDRKGKVFEFLKAAAHPQDARLTLDESLNSTLDPAQRELARIIALDTTDPLKPEYIDALSIATHIDQATGFPKKDSLVTTAYLRERHRPFLLAVQDLETRHQNRTTLLSLVNKQLSLIATLPGK